MAANDEIERRIAGQVSDTDSVLHNLRHHINDQGRVALVHNDSPGRVIKVYPIDARFMLMKGEARLATQAESTGAATLAEPSRAQNEAPQPITPATAGPVTPATPAAAEATAEAGDAAVEGEEGASTSNSDPAPAPEPPKRGRRRVGQRS